MMLRISMIVQILPPHTHTHNFYISSPAVQLDEQGNPIDGTVEDGASPRQMDTNNSDTLTQGKKH